MKPPNYLTEAILCERLSKIKHQNRKSLHEMMNKWKHYAGKRSSSVEVSSDQIQTILSKQDLLPETRDLSKAKFFFSETQYLDIVTS